MKAILAEYQAKQKFGNVVTPIIAFGKCLREDDSIVNTAYRKLLASNIYNACSLCCHGICCHDAFVVNEDSFEAHFDKKHV